MSDCGISRPDPQNDDCANASENSSGGSSGEFIVVDTVEHQVVWPVTPSSTGKKYYSLCKHHKQGAAMAVRVQKVYDFFGRELVVV